MGLCNLRHVQEEIEARKAVADRYRERIDGVKGLRLNAPVKGATENYAYFPVLVDETLFGKTRDQVFDALAADGVFARKYFYPAVNEQPYYSKRYQGRLAKEDTPVASYVAERIMTLPLYAGLKTADVDRICDIITLASK
jgi:dTDP-4-amino-4,6-dideoxygalactose transaminase